MSEWLLFQRRDGKVIRHRDVCGWGPGHSPALGRCLGGGWSYPLTSAASFFKYLSCSVRDFTLPSSSAVKSELRIRP